MRNARRTPSRGAARFKRRAAIRHRTRQRPRRRSSGGSTLPRPRSTNRSSSAATEAGDRSPNSDEDGGPHDSKGGAMGHPRRGGSLIAELIGKISRAHEYVSGDDAA